MIIQFQKIIFSSGLSSTGILSAFFRNVVEMFTLSFVHFTWVENIKRALNQNDAGC